jgi:hypothetical protein
VYSLVVWLVLFALTFFIWSVSGGIGSDAADRCAVETFVADYGRNCTGADQHTACTTRCIWEMKINLAIENVALALAVGGIIVSMSRGRASRMRVRGAC